MDDEPSARREPGVASFLGAACAGVAPVAATPDTAQDNTAPTVTAAQTTLARWGNEIERRFSRSDAGGARVVSGAASRGNPLPSLPSTRLLAGSGAVGMKSSLRCPAVALLFLGGVLGVGEAAHAQTVIWSATLEAESSGAHAGYHRSNSYGSLSSRNFTYKGKSFSVNSIYSSFGVTRMVFAGGGGHVERDLFGTSANPGSVTLNIGDGSWMASGSGVNFGGGLILIFSEVIAADNTYAVSITTTEPGAPQSLTATNVTSTGVTLSWSAPNSIGGSAITGYKYRYKASGASSFGDWTAISNSASLTSHPVQGLESSTQYTFQILATNDSGDGLYSDEVTATTLRGIPTAILVLDRNRISEDRGESTVTALLDRPSSMATTVTVSASPVSPATADDFTLSSNKVLTIAAEQTASTGVVTIAAVNNDDDDDNRQVTVSGVAENADGVTQPSSPTLTIVDDESASTTVTLTVSPTSVPEDATGAARTVTVTAELDGDPLRRTTQVTVSVSGDTAVAGTDYTAVPGFTFAIAAGDTSGTGTFTLAPIDDNLDEPDVTVAVTGTTNSGLSVEPESGLSVKILDDDDPPAVTLVLDPDSIDEDGGESTVTATLDKPSIEDIEVTVSASPVSPAVASDFTLGDEPVLTIEAGDTTSSGTVTITANDNDLGGGDQHVTVSGEAASDGDLTPPGDVTLTITEDDPVATMVTLTVDRSTVAEDAAGSDRTVTVSAELDGARAEATPVAVSVTGGTAVAGTDYATVDDFTVTIAARMTSGSATFTLAPVDDEVDEPGETVVVTGSTTVTNLTVAPANGVTVTITDNDPRPRATLVLTPATIDEDGGESTVTATLDRPSSAVTTITVTHARITGTSSSDYGVSDNKVLTIAAGQKASTGTVTFTGKDNDVYQPNARHVVVEGSASNRQGVRHPNNKLLTIREDEVASTKLTLSASPVSVSEGGGDQTVTLTATVDEGARVSGTPVRVSVSGGTAVAGTDYSAVEDFTFRIPPGRTSGTGTFTLTPIDDEADGPDKTVTVTATTPDSVGLPVEPVSGLTITIADDDGAPSGTLALTVDTIATDNTVNIAEKTAGFAISGTTGSEGGVAVSVTIGSQSPLSDTSDNNGAWSVTVPADATYITGTSVAVSVSASKTGFTVPSDVTRTLTVDLAAPSVSYTAPASLKVGVAISAVTPTTADTDIASYSATGLPSGLTIHAGTGAISGTPDTAATNTAAVTVTVTDSAANPADVSITFPTVDKGDQTLTGFAYSTDTVTFGDTAPTVTAPRGAQTPLEYSATPSTVCTVDSGTGALTLAGVGECVITVTAASSANYNQATATFTVTVQDTLALTVDTIATDDTVNLAEKAAGFAISGATGSEAGVSVTVTVGSMELTATSNSNGVWSVRVPANAAYITGTSVAVSVSASKTGFTAPSDVTRTLSVDLAAPSVSYTAPASLKVGVAISAVTPTTADSDIASYSATGLPSGLTINSSTGAISGTPDTAEANTASATVTVTDSAANPATVSLTFPTVDKGDQTLTGFAYSTDTVTFGDTAPTVMAPSGAQTPLAYSATPSMVCSVDSGTGALTLAGVGSCVATVTAESSANYNQTTATFTVTVQDTPTPTLDAKVTLTVSPTSVAEDATGTDRTVTVTATLDGESRSEDTEVTVSVAAGTAVEGADFSAVTDVTVTIAGGATSGTATFDLVPLDDNIDEPDETVIVSGTTTASDLTVEPADGVTLTIEDDEAPPVISLTLTPESISENGGASTVTAQLSHPSSEAVRVRAYMLYPHLYDGIVADWSSNRYLTFAAEQTASTGVVTIAAIDNEVDNPDRVVPIKGSLSAEVLNRGITFPKAAYLTVVDDDEAPLGTLALTVDTIATDNTVNIAEKTAGFAISGATGSEAGVSVTVTVGSMELTATSNSNGAWSVRVPANATYITGTSVNVSVSVSKTGFTAPNDVTRTLSVDLAAPSVSYTAPTSLKVGVAITAMTPTTTDSDIASYSATGLPSGLTINSSTGAISGTPDTAEANTASTTVTVTDTAGNPATVSLTYPTVDKGDQTLTGFAYSADMVTFGDTAPTVMAPSGAQTPLAYSATPSTVCTVDSGTGALTLAGVGECVITVTAESSANYNQATATFTVTVQDTLAPTLDAKVTLTVSPTSVAEDATGTDRTVTVTATLDGESRSEDTEVTVSVAAGTAVEGADFSAVTDVTVTIAGGATSGTATFDLVPLDDNIDEPDETVIVSGTTTASDLTVEPADGVTLTIEDDEAPPVISLTLTPESISENGGASTVTAQLSHPSSEAVRVRAYMLYPHLYDGIVADWSSNRYLTFAAGKTASTGVVTIAAIDNEVDNPDREVPIKGSLSAEVLNRGITFPKAAYLTVVDDDEAPLGTLALSVDAIATDNTVNIAEKTAGFAISGATGSEGGVTVSVTIGSQSPLNATSAEADPATWSVNVPANATYITGTSVAVSVSASKTGFTVPSDVTRTLSVDLAAPSVSYTAPAPLKVGVAIIAMTPTTADTDIASYSATGLPSGLAIHAGTGAISGTPDTASATTAAVTVTATDSAGNPATVSLTYPTVDKGDQTLTGFAYSTDTVTFGDTAPTVMAPSGAQTPLAYSATPSMVCSVDSTTGALTLDGVGECVVTVTAASNTNYNEATATFTVSVQDTLALTLDTIATDDTVNLAEKAAGFAISGATGSEAGVSVTVTVGSMELTATSNSNGAWSVNVPANATYITGTSVAVSVSVSKTGFTASTDVTRTLSVDLAAPSVSYTAPASLKVGVAITAMTPTTTDSDIASYSATGLPSGLTINSSTGAISGTPDTAEANTASATVTVTDTAGNPADVSVTFPTVDKGDQTLTGFAYSADTVTFGDTAPTVMAPSGAQTPLAYSATPSMVCSVDSGTGALTLDGVGECVVTVTAASDANYNEATATFTVSVQDTLALTLDAIATDDTVNLAEKAAGFTISGATGSEGGVAVSVTIGAQSPLSDTSDNNGAWSVTVPADATYITGTSVAVSVSASKTGFTVPSDVTRTLSVDLAAPSVSYTAPASLKVGVAITAMTPTTADTDIASYSATGLPSGLTINAGTGAISGTPDTAAANTAAVTVTVTDSAANPADVSITFPTVDKGDQTLTGFAYSTDTVTFGDTAPTLIAPTRAHTTLAYSATPSTVCSVNSTTGALTLAGVGECVITVTAASSTNYNEATATFTVTVQDTLALTLDAIATDDTVNLAEKTAGFAISGATGSEAGVSVTVTVGSMELTATSNSNGAWSVNVPANATYITGTSVAVSVSVSKTGFTAPNDVTRTLAVDLPAPLVSYTAPASLKVGVAITAMTPTTTDSDIASYSATGLPSGLTINAGTGAISGTPDTASATTAAVTVTVTDAAGNPATVSLTFPTVDKGDQTLTGFAYSTDTVTFGDTAPTVMAPSGAQTPLAYSATPSTVCSVNSTTGALTLAGVGECVITVTAASSANYNQATATFTVTVQDTLALSVDAIATDDTVNIAEKTAGFAISGTTGSEGGVSVTVTVGSMTLTATSAEADPATWSVTVPANAAYITGTSVAVSVSASKTGFTAPSDVTRTLSVDLAAPSVSYTAPASLKVGVAITAMTPTTADTDIASYSATGLPSGLAIHAGTGAISGTPDTASATTAAVTVTATDSAGNPADVSITFPTVDKGDQTLTGFAYSADTVTFGDTAPTVTAPTRAQTPLAYSATPSTVCTVDAGTGALTLAGVGECVITVTAESSANYNQATATFTVTVYEPVPTTPGKPHAPQISSGNGRVIVQWLAPSFDGGTPILRYEYCLQPIYQCSNQWVEIPNSAPGGANHGRYAIARDNGAYTSLYLRAVNAQGASPQVNLQVVALAGAPPAPTNLTGEAISAEHVLISWREPVASPGVTITGYDLERSRDGVTWAHDVGCQYPCRQQNLGGRWEPRGTNSVTVRIGPNATLYYRIRTIFRTNTPTLVGGMDLSRGSSPTSPIVEVTTVGTHGTLALPTLAVRDGFGREGPNAAIVFDVTLTGPQRRPSPVTVSYRTQDMTAHAGSDYTSRSGTLVFQPDETEKTVSVPIIDDTVEDSGEEFALRLSNVSGAHLSRAGGFGTIYNSEDILGGFTLVNAASGTDVGGLDDGATVSLDNPRYGQYGMRVGTVPGTGVNSVRLELSGAKTVTRTDNEAPFTLHAEGGEGLPPGAYTLQATAYPEADRGGNALQTISVSFTVAASTQDEEEGTALSATFPASPYASRLHEGTSDRPRVVVAFSEAVTAIAANTPSAVVTGGTIASVRAYTEDGLSNAWIFFVTPDGDGDVTFTLVAGAACDNGGICTASGTTLTQAPAARTLPGPGDDDEGTDDSGNTSLTASFSAMPGEHGGPGERFSFDLMFSEAPEVGYRKVRDDAFTVTGGAVRSARRLEKPSNIRWQITVEPSGWGDVAISLPGGRACTSSGGICTSDNRMLANSPSAIVQGPAALSVADANAREGTDATLDFAVTLDRASPLTVTVHYATADGTAAAGADYTATSGTLSFAPGDLAKTVSVPILDDAHDEGSETLTLTLSNATGARIRDAWATGTIENSDPIPKAWLARFGRTVADHVVDAVGERLEGSPGGGSQVTLGGQRIPLGGAGNGPFPGSTAGSDTREDGTAADTLAAFAARMSDDGAGTGRVNRGDGGAEDAARRRASRTLNEREMLLGSSFVLALGGAGGTGTAWTAWGRAAASGFDGVADGLSVDGEVTTFTLGADAARGRWLGGVALARSTGEGGFRDHADSDHDGGGTGTLESTLASVHPYLRFRATERLSLWGVLGYGTGDLTLAVDAAGTQPRRTWKTDTGMWMAASGARGVLLSAPDTGGFELAARGDVRFVGMRSEASTGADGAGPLAATESETSRLRFLLEGSHRIELADGQTLRPSLEVGLRHDGGDAEIGTGIEVGAGVSYADPELGLTVEGKARGLVAHKATDYREWGASGSVRIDPGAAGRGLAISLSPSWGADTGGAERLWSARDARGLGARDDSFERAGRLEAEAGYGLGAFGGRGVMTPFAGLALSDAGNRTWRGGVRWTLGPTVAFGVEGALRETANDNAAEHEIGFKLTARF